MARLGRNFDQGRVAQRLSRSLDDVVANLVEANDAKAFVTALDKNGAVWREIQAHSSMMDLGVSPELVNFALSASNNRGVDDHTIELIIAINARVAGQIG
ncbi:MAG: hypothetical protein HY985_14930 [Magnetospirillum sp.]|nr:hypothetical protein [Magnetospirillum sp.]